MRCRPRGGARFWPSALALCAACRAPAGAGGSPDEDLGGFHVAASQVKNGCGAGALGSPPSYAFDIDLSRDEAELYWGRQASGALDPDLGFDFSASVRVVVTPPSPVNEGCAIGRQDHITGTLHADTDGNVVGFAGQLSHAFAPASDSVCSIDDRLAAGLPTLPCEMDYSLDGQLSRKPD